MNASTELNSVPAWDDDDESADYNSAGPLLPAQRYVLPIEWAGWRLDQVLAKLYPDFSRSRLQTWVKAGQVQLNGKLAQSKLRINGGEQLDVAALSLPASTEHAPENIALDIVFEDEHILVLNKPAGLVVHPGHGNERGTLLNGLLHHAPDLATLPRAGIVHRLDKETSGLMVVAKTLLAQTSLVRQLQAHEVGRHYWALVHGHVLRPGKVDARIARHPSQRIKMAVSPGGREAVTHYRPVQHWAHCTWIECRLETGRTHQIRVHLNHIGHPLLGDPVYGARRPHVNLPPFARQALHAFRLGLTHPQTGEACEWSVPLPADFSALLTQLGTPLKKEDV